MCSSSAIDVLLFLCSPKLRHCPFLFYLYLIVFEKNKYINCGEKELSYSSLYDPGQKPSRVLDYAITKEGGGHIGNNLKENIRKSPGETANKMEKRVCFLILSN